MIHPDHRDTAGNAVRTPGSRRVFRGGRHREWTYLLVSCLLAYPAYEMRGFGSLTLVLFVPFLFCLGEAGKRSARSAFGFGLRFGMVFFAINTVWMYSVLPLSWLGLDLEVQGFLCVTLFLLFYSLIYGAVIGVWSASFVSVRYRGVPKILIGAALWVIAEYVVAILIGTLSFSYTGPNGIFGNIGTPLADIPYLLPLTELGGMAMLSLFVMIVNLVLFQVISELRDGGIPFAPALLLVGLLLVPFAVSASRSVMPDDREVTATVFTTAILPTGERHSESVREAHKRVERILGGMAASGQKSDIIIFPEEGSYLSPIGRPFLASLLHAVLSEKGVAIDSDIVRVADGSERHKISYYGSDGTVSATSEKRMLVPFGEYLPNLVKRIFSWAGLGDWLTRMDYARRFSVPTADTRFETGILPAGGSIATFFCSEILSQDLYSEAARNGASVLANISSQSIFKGDERYYLRTVQWAKIHAATHYRPFIFSGNYATSFVVAPDGTLAARAYGDTNETASAFRIAVPLINGSTFYDRIGFDWVTVASFGMVGISLIGAASGSIIRRHRFRQ